MPQVEGIDVEEEVVAEEVTSHEKSRVKALPPPELPAEHIIREHEVTHVPFRSWCRHCVRGRAPEDGHFRRRRPHDWESHVISSDYLLIGSGEEGVSGGTVLVLKCHATKVVTAVPLPQKGAADVNVQVVADAVISFGRSHVAFRNDGEPSLKALMSKVADEVRRREIGVMQLTEEQTVAYDSNSAGAAESAVKTVQGIARSLLLSLQEKAGGIIPVRLSCWMVPFLVVCRF